MALAAIHVKKPREAQIWNCCTGNPVFRILPDSNILFFTFGFAWACFARWFFTLMTANGPLIRMNAACCARWFSHVHSCCMLRMLWGCSLMLHAVDGELAGYDEWVLTTIRTARFSAQH